MLKSYKYRLLPTSEQSARLDAGINACRFVYNLALETKIRVWESAKIRLSAFDLIRQLTELKRSGLADWLNDSNAQSLQSAISKMDTAFKRFFSGGGFPKFKKKTTTGSLSIPQGTKIKDESICFEKYGWFYFVCHRPIPDGVDIRTATISKTATGKFFVSILVDDGKIAPEKKPIKKESTVGIDLGLKAFAVLSDGIKINNPRFLHSQLSRLRIEQRTLARRYVKGKKTTEQSKGWHKQRLVVAKLQEKIGNRRSDFLHKLSDSITKNYDTICLEDLNVSGMIKNRTLSKAIADVSWSEFNRMLEYKAGWRGKNILRIGRFAPSSKTCSSCGLVNTELKLSDRRWACECGEIHERDLNAAINIKNFGLNTKPSIAKTTHESVSIG